MVGVRSSSFNFKNLIPAVILIVINENIAQIIACFRVVIFAANEPKNISIKLETKIKTTKPINTSKITSSITNSPNVLAMIKDNIVNGSSDIITVNLMDKAIDYLLRAKFAE